MAAFDSKIFNPEVFAKYMETVPRVKQNALLTAGIYRNRPELKNMLVDQAGGNYITVPMVGLIGGTADNYDGATNINVDKVDTYAQSMIVYGRAHAWGEYDFATDVTGKNFLEEAGKQIGNYFDDIQQGVVLSILKGIFAMTGTNKTGFVDPHTYTVKALSASTLNGAITKACGANRGIMTMVIMNSSDVVELEKLNLVDYAKHTDAQGIQKDVNLVTWNGRTVLLDDTIPAGTIYVLGQGAFDYCDVGAKVPYEAYRNPSANGGQDILYTRERKLIAPRGISFVQPSSPIVSPTNANFETAARWALVKNADGSATIDHKAIPIARIVVDAGASAADE